MLRDYLVQDVEDPRINVQSVLTRHFLAVALSGERHQPLAEDELRFAAAMNWLLKLTRQAGSADELLAVHHALRRGADNAEGIEIPSFLRRLFASLSAHAGEQAVPNYIEEFLLGTQWQEGQVQPHQPSLNLFQFRWHEALAGESPRGLRVLEPACGSANDYRFLDAYGLARLIDYTGFDLCEANVANARALFPHTRFEVGNVFAIDAPDASFDCCFVHDLFEHLSLEGLEAAVAELCRVTRRSLCLHFFNLDEIPEHLVQPVNDYHWNTLSRERVQELFARHGFAAQVLHIGSLLRWRVGCEETHNPNACTFILFRQEV